MSEIHMKLTGQRTLEQHAADARANPQSKEMHETREVTLPPGVHGRFIEALGGHVDVRLPAGVHRRLNTAVGR
ncbi:MAG: hypothetical protein HYY95_07915 [Candidatus Rokubacteria bacterium]|nr:hypothetical protein [Candidatus Rokubacteria bacterium]MBI3105482.1 hypothetical protein [Candidatus Rokubacteria bacterium]